MATSPPTATSLTFETAAFADAIKKAAALAPTTGTPFDKAGGIVLDIDPSGEAGYTVLVRTTDLDVFRIEWIDPQIAEGKATRWRLPSALFAKVVSTLPIGTGKSVTIQQCQGENFVRLISGRTRAQFNLIKAEYYPDWPIFDPAELSETQDLGGRLSQVEWAAAKSGEPLNGVHFRDGLCIATNRYRIACAPLQIPGDPEPFTVPTGILPTLLKQTGEVKVGLSGGQFLIMPDETTQIRAIMFGESYPNVSRILDPFRPEKVQVKKTALLEILNRAYSYSASDRAAGLVCYIGREEFAVHTTNREMGNLGDVLEIVGQAKHKRTRIVFTPANIIDSLNNAPNEQVEIGYDPEQPRQPVYIDGGSGYQAWVAPRLDNQNQED